MERKYKAEVDVAVLMLFFNRPEHFSQVFEQVREARPSKLFLYQDGPREGRNDMEGILACRKIAENIDWKCEVHQHYCEKNQGCDPSGYLSRKWVFETVDKVIILEDDTVPSQSFFPFCKELLDKYENDDRITMISGMNYDDVTEYCPYDYFFTSDAAIWGWATWKRVFDKWDAKYSYVGKQYEERLISNNIKNKNLRRNIYSTVIEHKKEDIAYFESILIMSMLLSNGLAIVPKKNMIHNVGMEANSTHFNGTVKSLPKAWQEMYTMPTHEIDFPLKHPLYVMEDYDYNLRINKRQARNMPLRRRYYQVITLLKRIRHGEFSAVLRSFKK